MPTYGYECTSCKEQFEVFQRITEDALAIHEACGGELRRLVYPVGIVFKGSGFHVNDYTSTGRKTEPKAESKSGAVESKTEAKTETKPESKSDAKSETKAASSS